MKLLAMMFWLGMGMVLTGAEEAGHVYSVCELLANPQRFNGRTIKVRGIVEGGMEGSWLESDNCPERFYVGEYSLPKAISLSYRSEFGVAAPRNMAHIERVDQQIQKKLRKMKSSVLLLTHTGVFEARTAWKLLNNGSGDKRLWGFGHLNGFPAQLVIIDIEDPLIVRKK